uniref:Torsin family 3 member A n=1 Tax=Nothoprocta perdicaria TaxID=30464 RepID=A0A8C6ZK04_NOTPE
MPLRGPWRPRPAPLRGPGARRDGRGGAPGPSALLPGSGRDPAGCGAGSGRRRRLSPVWGPGTLPCCDRGPSPGWSLPLVGQDFLEILSAWYCSFGSCGATGDCRVLNNVTGLESELNGQLHGQHLAGEVVLRAVRGFLQKPQPEKALVLSFHGWSGTGKNFVARMVASHLYRDGLRSECVRTFISLFHFPHAQYVDSYKVQGPALLLYPEGPGQTGAPSGGICPLLSWCLREPPCCTRWPRSCCSPASTRLSRVQGHV